jgi:ferritin-like metal-binding protein YciE
MNVDDFRQMYITELQELRSVEEQLAQALPKMADVAEHPDLKEAIATHTNETRSQRDRLDQLLSSHGANPREHRDASMQALIAEANRWARMVQDRDLRDAGLIASAQRIEHYEIAVYGTLATWAKQLSLNEDLRILLEILDEEKRTDELLTDLAKRVINPEAASA